MQSSIFSSSDIVMNVAQLADMQWQCLAMWLSQDNPRTTGVTSAFSAKGVLGDKEVPGQSRDCQCYSSLVPRHQIFRARPAALSKNRVWTGLVPRLLVGGERKSLVSTVRACA